MVSKEPISWSDFSKVEMRVGTILSAELFKELNIVTTPHQTHPTHPTHPTQLINFV